MVVSCLIKQGIKIENIRGQERKTGINSEDLALIRLLSLSTEADIEGNHLSSSELLFLPKHSPKALKYELRVHEMIKGKGQNNATIILASALLVLAKTKDYSHLNIQAHTHASSGEHYDFFEHLILNLYKKQGIHTFPHLRSTTFDKKSMGEVSIEIEPSIYLSNIWEDRGRLKVIKIILSEYKLPLEIQKNIVNQLSEHLKKYDIEPFIQVIPLNSKNMGFSITLLAEFENGLGGYSICKSEVSNLKDDVQSLYNQFEEWMESKTTLSPNLLPYALIPMIFSDLESIFITSHLESSVRDMIWTLKQMIPLKLTITETLEKKFKVCFKPS